MKKSGYMILAVAAVAGGWIAGTLFPISPLKTAASPPIAGSMLPPALSAFASVPDVRQSTDYTCGAAALQAVLAYWGKEEREDRLTARLHGDPELGIHPLDILRVAREFGLSADLREGLDLADLEAALASGTTVIVDLQAWRGPTDLPWAETWDDGHYMVLLGMDTRNLYFEDPSLLGSRGFISRGEFVERWHDYEGDPPLDAEDRVFVHTAIFIRGAQAAPMPEFTPVE